MVSNSERPFGSSSRGMRSDSGMSTRSPSIESTPIVVSISVRSSGEWTRYGTLGAGLRGLLVRVLVHEVFGQLARNLQLEDPAIAVGVGVDQLGHARQLVVDAGHAPRDRGVKVAGGLHRLHDPETLARLELATRAGQFEKNNIPKLRLREVGDAYGDGLTIDRDPFVGLRIKPARHAFPPFS